MSTSHLYIQLGEILLFGTMELNQIKTNLQNPDFKYRLDAIAALKDYPPEVALPLLTKHLQDPEFLVRSFVARGLGKQQTSESFAALLQIIKFDNTPNVQAEAANSLSLFGRVSASHLVEAFFMNDHWLLRRSILAALIELECPEELFEVCIQGLEGEDASVKEASIEALGTLADSNQHQTALSQLLILTNSQSERIRIQIAYALKHYDDPDAKKALAQLRQDTDHRVIGAAMEDLI
jgi:HEAT repeat protein